MDSGWIQDSKQEKRPVTEEVKEMEDLHADRL